jgi:hypothetical protein
MDNKKNAEQETLDSDNPPGEENYEQILRISKDRIAEVFGVPVSLIQDPVDSTYSSFTTRHLLAWFALLLARR